MTLTTHIALASALGAPLADSNPLVLIVFAMGTHYLADSIPHYDYKLRYAFNEDRNAPPFNTLDFLIHDCGRVGFDMVLGAMLAITAFGLDDFLANPLPYVCLGLGSILPDILSALNAGKPTKFLQWNQSFQNFTHAKKLSRSYINIFSQILILVGALAFIHFF